MQHVAAVVVAGVEELVESGRVGLGVALCVGGHGGDEAVAYVPQAAASGQVQRRLAVHIVHAEVGAVREQRVDNERVLVRCRIGLMLCRLVGTVASLGAVDNEEHERSDAIRGALVVDRLQDVELLLLLGQRLGRRRVEVRWRSTLLLLLLLGHCCFVGCCCCFVGGGWKDHDGWSVVVVVAVVGLGVGRRRGGGCGRGHVDAHLLLLLLLVLLDELVVAGAVERGAVALVAGDLVAAGQRSLATGAF